VEQKTPRHESHGGGLKNEIACRKKTFLLSKERSTGDEIEEGNNLYERGEKKCYLFGVKYQVGRGEVN